MSRDCCDLLPALSWQLADKEFMNSHSGKTSASSTHSSSMSGDLKTLRDEVTSIRKEVDTLKQKNSKKWYEIAAVLIGLVGGLIAVPAAINGAVHVFTDRPKTTVTWSRPLDVAYKATDQSLELLVPIVINNEGARSEEVVRVSAQITVPGSSNIVPTNIDDSDIQFREGDKTFSLPFYVKSEEPRAIAILLDVPAPWPDRILAVRGRKQLNVQLVLHEGKRNVKNSYCFDLQKDDYASPRSQEKHLITPDC